MENYRILNRLGKGGQGAVYLCEHRKDKKKCVLKKVECNDESEANKAFKEAMALKELQHHYMCGYREFFVTWDKEDCAMYVCIVMDYYSKGDLANVLRQRRDKGELLDELMIKKWLGQIIEALIFIHKNKVIHRDLKPSNIFLQDDLNICVGDFGVATVMGDVRTKTRTAVGSMNWMAPEVLERPYDERSDVWSLGCIALELITCGLFDSIAMAGKLCEIKYNAQALEDILQEASKSYSLDLISVTRQMLTINYSERPTALELVNVPYIKDCMVLSDSALAEKQKGQKSVPVGGTLPKNRGTTAVFEYLHINLVNENSVKEALQELVKLTKENSSEVDSSEKKCIVKAMDEYKHNVDIQIAACNTLNNLIMTAHTTDILYSKEVIQTVQQSMKIHSNNVELQQAAVSLLIALSADEGASKNIGLTGSLQDILGAMRSFPKNAEIITTCCNALWSLSVNENNTRIITEAKGINDVMDAINAHAQYPELLEAAAAALLSLSIEGQYEKINICRNQNLEIMNERDCVGSLLKAIEKHVKEPKVVKNSCMALAALVEPSEESAFTLLSHVKNNVETQGLLVIAKAYEQHRDNAEVVETICSLLLELAEYDEIRAEAKHLKIGDNVLADVHKRFKDNPHVMEPCEAALEKIGSTKVVLKTKK